MGKRTTQAATPATNTTGLDILEIQHVTYTLPRMKTETTNRRLWDIIHQQPKTDLDFYNASIEALSKYHESMY